MSTTIENSVIWLTGASSGIGEALAINLSKQGAKLILSSRRKDELERVKAACVNPQWVEILELDLAKPESLSAKASEAKNFFGSVDILINNGGVSQRDKAINTSLEVDRKVMEVNYFGSIALSKAVLKDMVDKKKGMQVVISSVTGIISTPLRSSYAASKHALHGFYDSLRAEHHQDNIKVLIVCPGFIKTNISINAFMGDGSKQGKMDKAQDRGMTADHCAKQIISAIKRNKEEVYIGGFKEITGVYLKRLFPSLFSKILNKTAVT